ncbi:hypothetical protein DL771_009908 [Monosporascus sp. 5C6A]|nr:hypothetical protein DL771_009908 [Monosporascus sp. 5C6A]
MSKTFAHHKKLNIGQKGQKPQVENPSGFVIGDIFTFTTTGYGGYKYLMIMTTSLPSAKCRGVYPYSSFALTSAPLFTGIPPLRQVQRRPSVLVLRVNVRPVLHQYPHHRLVASLCPPVQRSAPPRAISLRQVQRRPSVLDLHANVRPFLYQQLCHSFVPSLCCPVQRRPPVIILCVNVRPFFYQERYHRFMPSFCRLV